MESCIELGIMELEPMFYEPKDYIRAKPIKFSWRNAGEFSLTIH